jgi:phospholipase C
VRTDGKALTNAELQAEADALHRKIERIVVVMMENRSFDHMLGWLGPSKGGPPADFSNPDAAGKAHAVQTTFTTALAFDPPHGNHGSVARQVDFNEKTGRYWMDGFVKEFERRRDGRLDERRPPWAHADLGLVMSQYHPAAVPAYRFLAQNHLVCARYFSSVQSGTWVNRMLFYAGTSNGIVDSPEGTLIRGKEYRDHMPGRLLIDLLEEKNVSWAIYADGMAWMRLFRDGNRLPLLRTPDFRRHFADHARKGKLPDVVFVDPNWDPGRERRGNDDHIPSDVFHGQEFIRDVYQALATQPDPEGTLMVVVYDEHGGFFDHVPPPPVPGWTDDPAKTNNAVFRDHGVRVPCLLASSYVDPGVVVTDESLVFDHVSVHATIHRMFVPSVPFLDPRVAAARTLAPLVTRTRSRPWPSMPAIKRAVAAGPAGPGRGSN